MAGYQRQSGNRVRGHALVVLLLAAVIFPGNSTRLNAANPKTQIHYFIHRYGKIDQRSDEKVRKAYRIFTRVLRVADKKSKYTPRLVVVKSDSDPWAISLPAGYIVLSKAAIDICYKGVKDAAGDARLAFVLGHELAHLAKDDFWHSDVYLALAHDPQADRLRTLLANTTDVVGAETESRFSEMRQKELQADDWGFLYAALAGYPVQTLLNKQVDGSGSFFSLWMKQTNTRVDRAHPAPEDRARLLQTRLQTLLKTVRYFEFGVRLAYFGRYEEAIPLFEAVQREFPSREVLGALGYSYLRLAEQEMISTEAYRFWLPRELDINTRLKSLEFHPVRGADGEPDPVVEGYLRRAEDFLQRAVVADPGYVPAWRNLFTVQFHLRDFLMAQGTIGKLLKLEDVNSEYIGLQALSAYFSQLDNTPEIALQALQPLRKEAEKPTAPASVLYNLAMLNALPDKSQTKALWERLNAVAKTVPGPYQARICQQVTPDQCKFENGAQETCAYSLKIKSPLQPGLDLWALPDGGAKLLRQWKSIPFQWSELNRNGRFFYLPDEDIEALEINNMIELVVIRGKRLNNATINIAVCPASETDVSGGTIIRLDAQQALLTREDKSQELWLLRKRGR